MPTLALPRTWAQGLAALSLAVASSLALALPSPKDIESAVNAGQLPQAETLLREVIQAKPGSARAHYELAQVLARQGRRIEAHEELLLAQKLDPSLKFASSPERFKDLLGKVSGPGGGTASPSGTASASPASSAPMSTQSTPSSQAASSPSAKAAAAHPAPAPREDTGLPWGGLLLGAGGLFLLWRLMRRKAAPRPAAPAWGRPGGSGPMGTAQPGPYAGHYPSGPSAPAGGSGMGGAVLGGLAGLAAGYGLAKVLEGNEAHAQTPSSASAHPDFGSGHLPGQPDYGAFDGGSGDSWDSGGDAGGGSDEW